MQSYPYIVNLPTSLRIEFPGAIYHLTSRGNARQKIYRDHADLETFLINLSHVVDRYAWRCHTYCLMDNHDHLLIETPNETGRKINACLQDLTYLYPIYIDKFGDYL